MKVLSCLACCAVISLIGCKVAPTSSERQVTTANLKLADNEISGWTLLGDNGFRYFEGHAQLEGLINGGAEVYSENGMVNGFFQEMKNSAGESTRCQLMDYGTLEKATAMFNMKKTTYSSHQSLPTLSDTVAIAKDALSASCFAHKSRFYLEFELSGISDLSVARTKAEMFIKTYFAKIP